MIVVDASVILDLILAQSTAETLGQRLFAPTETLHAPELLDLEVLQVLRPSLASRVAQCDTWARSLFRIWPICPSFVIRMASWSKRIWQLRANVTAYDAAYLALAEALERSARHPGREAGPRAGSCRARRARVTSDAVWKG